MIQHRLASISSTRCKRNQLAESNRHIPVIQAGIGSPRSEMGSSDCVIATAVTSSNTSDNLKVHEIHNHSIRSRQYLVGMAVFALKSATHMLTIKSTDSPHS